MTATARLTEAELEERAALQRQWSRLPSAEVVSLDTKRRPPLGLSISADDDGPPERDLSSYDRHNAGETLARQAIDNLGGPEVLRQHPATMVDVFEQLGVAIQCAMNCDDTLYEGIVKQRGRITELETELARERAAVAELRATQHEHAFILERLKVEGKGPRGERGLMGRDGREGARGERGAKGADGRAGAPGPRIIGWTLDEQAFTATPLLSDDRKGAVLHLMPLFQSYTEQMEASDAAEEHDAVQAQRAVVEREASNVRLGLPAR